MSFHSHFWSPLCWSLEGRGDRAGNEVAWNPSNTLNNKNESLVPRRSSSRPREFALWECISRVAWRCGTVANRIGKGLAQLARSLTIYPRAPLFPRLTASTDRCLVTRQKNHWAFDCLFCRAARDNIIDQVRQMLPKDACTRERRRPARYTLPRSKKLRFPKCPPRAFVMNKGALFMQPHRCLPGHFEIHPEFQKKNAFPCRTSI